MKSNLPVMDPALLHLQSPDATARCPTGSIVWIEGAQFASDAEAEFSSAQRLKFETADVVSQVQSSD